MNNHKHIVPLDAQYYKKFTKNNEKKQKRPPNFNIFIIQSFETAYLLPDLISDQFNSKL